MSSGQPDFHLKVSDTLPILEATLLDAKREPINLTSVVSITFRMRRKKSDPFIDITATVVAPATDGKVTVPWSGTSGSTDAAGTFQALFKLLFPGPETMSVPNKGCKVISIEDDC